MRKSILFFACMCILFSVSAQRKNFSYKFYGFVRGDLFYNSRSNAEAVDGTFFLYPLNERLDPDGNDLNANPNSSFYTFTTRAGLDINGPDVGKARSSAKVEADFGGFSPNFFTLRIRHAYVKFDWERGSSVLLGQTWHPLFGDVMPEIMNLNTGGPFQPFNRSPMFRYEFGKEHFTISASAIYQLMYPTNGPNGKSEEYLKNGNVPELYVGANYKNGGFLAGAGVYLLSIKPRIHSTITNGDNSQTFKVDERLTDLSFVAQAKYTSGKLFLAGKTLLASNLGHTTLLGGYGVSAEDARTGEREYTSNRFSTSWVNAVYGGKWRGGIFGGYSKNLGTGKALLNTTDYYGTGIDIDQLVTIMGHFSYNLPHWKAGLEYGISTAWYGDTELSSGKVKNTSSITNHRLMFMFTYYF